MRVGIEPDSMNVAVPAIFYPNLLPIRKSQPHRAD
jgi:hypothetical protein